MEKREPDRRLFAAILAVALLASFIISIVIGSVPVSAETEASISGEEMIVEIENETLELRYDEVNGTISILGEGTLSAEDLNALLTKYDVLISDIENVIIGDGITEVGYNAFNGYEYLYSIKFGNTVEKIRNGAVKNCINLRFVSLPSAVKKIARDFLFGTTRCYVISDGQIADMLLESNVENVSVIENITSYGALKAAIEENEVVYQSFPSDKLSTTDPDAGTSPIILHSNYRQYGPYTTLGKGEYTVHVLGKGFSYLNSEALYFNISGYNGEYSVSRVAITDDMISYDLMLSNGSTNVEMGLNNNSIEEVEIYELQIFEKMDIPDVLKMWW